MTRRKRRTEDGSCRLSEEAQAMLSRNSELTRIDPLFRRTKHQDEAVLSELRDAGIFRGHRRNSNTPIPLSELGTEQARIIRKSRLSLEPKDLDR